MPECYMVPDKNIILKNIDLICQIQHMAALKWKSALEYYINCNGQNNYIIPTKKKEVIFTENSLSSGKLCLFP